MDYFNDSKDSAKTIPKNDNLPNFDDDIYPGEEPKLTKYEPVKSKLDELFGESETEKEVYIKPTNNEINTKVNDRYNIVIQPEKDTIIINSVNNKEKSPFDDIFDKPITQDNKVKNDFILDFDEINYLNNLVHNQNNQTNTQIPKPKQQANLIEDVSHLRNSTNLANISNKQPIFNDKVELNSINLNINQLTQSLASNTYQSLKNAKDIFKVEDIQYPLGQLRSYLKDSQRVFTLENIFLSKEEHAKINKFNSLSHFPQMISYFNKAFENTYYLGSIDPEGLTIENNIIFDEERIRLNKFFSETNEFIRNFNYRKINNFSIGPFEKFIALFESSDLEYYRDIISDGDSFFRSFIFNYIELAILTCNKLRLHRLFYNFYNRQVKSQPDLITNINQNDQNYFLVIDTCPLITVAFCEILNLLERNLITDAHEYFLRSFIGIQAVEQGLIAYTRFAVIDFIHINDQIIQGFDMYYPENLFSSDLKSNLYMSDEGYNYQGLCKEMSYLKTEISPFGILMLAYTFDVDISILNLFEKDCERVLFTNKRDGLIDNRISNNFPCLFMIKNNQYKSKSLLSASNGYLVGYNLQNLYKNGISNEICNSLFSNTLYKGEVLFTSKVSSGTCYICGNKSNLFTRIKDLNYSYCGICIEASLKRIISKRQTQIKNEGYVFTECKYILLYIYIYILIKII